MIVDLWLGRSLCVCVCVCVCAENNLTLPIPCLHCNCFDELLQWLSLAEHINKAHHQQIGQPGTVCCKHNLLLASCAAPHCRRPAEGSATTGYYRAWQTCSQADWARATCRGKSVYLQPGISLSIQQMHERWRQYICHLDSPYVSTGIYLVLY